MRHIRVETLAQRDIHAGAQQLLCLLGLAPETVDNPSLKRMQCFTYPQQVIERPHTMDDHGLATNLAQYDLLTENFLLQTEIHRPGLVESRFADKQYIRAILDYCLETIHKLGRVVKPCVPRMNPQGDVSTTAFHSMAYLIEIPVVSLVQFGDVETNHFLAFRRRMRLVRMDIDQWTHGTGS